MSLWIMPSPNNVRTEKAKSDLMNLAFADPGLTIGTTVQENGFPVTYNRTVINEFTEILADLSRAGYVVRIRGESGDFPLGGAFGGTTLQDKAGQTQPDTFPDPTKVTIVYNVDECNGQPYSLQNDDGSTIALPRNVILANEIGEAYAIRPPERPSDTQREEESRRVENLYRRLRNLPRRVGLGRLKCPAGDSGGLFSDCVIATAAFGSGFAPDVELLRRFRDDVLRSSRSGAAFFDRYWEQYYRISPPIAAAMWRDEQVRDVVRSSVVVPMVEYFRLFLDLPDAPLDTVPEPWRSFLVSVRARMEHWAETFPLPRDFAGLTATQASIEIEVVLRYMLRTEGRRREYLDSLRLLGQIPLEAGPQEAATIIRRLQDSGRPATEIEQIITSAATAEREADRK